MTTESKEDDFREECSRGKVAEEGTQGRGGQLERRMVGEEEAREESPPQLSLSSLAALLRGRPPPWPCFCSLLSSAAVLCSMRCVSLLRRRLP